MDFKTSGYSIEKQQKKELHFRWENDGQHQLGYKMEKKSAVKNSTLLLTTKLYIVGFVLGSFKFRQWYINSTPNKIFRMSPLLLKRSLFSIAKKLFFLLAAFATTIWMTYLLGNIGAYKQPWVRNKANNKMHYCKNKHTNKRQREFIKRVRIIKRTFTNNARQYIHCQ